MKATFSIHSGTDCSIGSRYRGRTLLIKLVVLLTLASAQFAVAQIYTVLHVFSGGSDGGAPYGRLAMDRVGNLYGVNAGGLQNCRNGGVDPCGMSFRMSRRGTGWILAPLYMFSGGADGAFPSTMTLGPDGALYGTTQRGGQGCPHGDEEQPPGSEEQPGCGLVYRLSPASQPCFTAYCPWVETVLYNFQQTGGDGLHPAGGVVFDNAGNIYGTTPVGGGTSCFGGNGCGAVYKLTPSGNGWTETIIYRFTGGSDGYEPEAGVIFDRAGNIYGTTYMGGNLGGIICGVGCGTVYKLTPSDSGWIETILYRFTGGNGGAYPLAGLTLDAAGNLYGTTSSGGSGEGGTLFELSPSGGNWTFSVLYAFTGPFPSAPYESPAIDPAGNLYSPNLQEPSYNGSVFKLAPADGQWFYTDLHDFNGADGSGPWGGLILDLQGNLYGSTAGGGGGGGVIWEIRPSP
jgi:uncharacterized repeat protein (TIGR03803 family)